MIQFIDGPAKGIAIPFAPAPMPIFLRVALDPQTQTWQAIHRVDYDGPAGQVHAYILTAEPTFTMVDDGGIRKRIVHASYAISPVQPLDADVRDLLAWKLWTGAMTWVLPFPLRRRVVEMIWGRVHEHRRRQAESEVKRG